MSSSPKKRLRADSQDGDAVSETSDETAVVVKASDESALDGEGDDDMTSRFLQLLKRIESFTGNDAMIEAPGDAQSFRFITTQVGALSTLFTCLSSLFIKARIVISDEGIVSTSISTAHTCMARWVLRRDELVESMMYPPRKTISIVIDLSELALLISSCSKADMICFTFDNDFEPQFLQVYPIEDGCVQNHRLSTMIEENFIEIPQVVYNNRTTLDSGKFSDRIRTKIDTDKVVIDLKDDVLEVLLEGTMRRMGYSFPLHEHRDEHGIVTNNGTAQHPSVVTPQTFILDIIQNITRITRVTKFVDISMPEAVVQTGADGQEYRGEKPLCLVYVVAALGTVSFFVAPWIGE
jgi:hypothetical protein